MKTTKIGILAIAFLFIGLAGCNNDEMVDEAPQEVLDETTFAENTFEQLASDIDEVSFADMSESARLAETTEGDKVRWFKRFGYSDCVTVTREMPGEGEFPIIITIDYGEGCGSWMWDVVKSGKIIITITGKMSEEGSKRLVTFEYFKVNGNLIEGEFTFTNLGNASWSRVLVGGKITTEEGVITRESERIRTRIEGGDTDDRSDDVFKITGKASGKTLEDNTYTMDITSPLIRSKDCFWITEGTIEKVINETTVITIDFGEGECDNLATKQIGDEEPEEFEMNCRMKRWKWMWRHNHRHMNNN
jgi:hypothetical protein